MAQSCLLTYLTQIPGKSWWTSAVETVNLVNACSIVQTRVAVTLVDICKKDNHSKLEMRNICHRLLRAYGPQLFSNLSHTNSRQILVNKCS